MSDHRTVVHPPVFLGAKRRRKGANRLSCAECRRLKLRCDRSIPCGSCVKRGCGPICPDGSLTTGQGNRFVLASTSELHEKIGQLATRVRELEDALRATHCRLSADRHPLLSEELLRIKAPLERQPRPALPVSLNGNKEEESETDIVDAIGSLSISLTGRSKYFGQTANSWYFLLNESEPHGEEEDQLNDLRALEQIMPAQILKRAAAFPISAASKADNVGLQSLIWYLPTAEVAHRLRSIYFTYAAWMYNPISLESFDKEVYSRLYDDMNSRSHLDNSQLAYQLALMFMVLAIGSLMDTSLPAYNLEAEKYNQLACAALFHESLFQNPSINSVQALYLMTHYLFLSDRHGSDSGARWVFMGIAVKMGQSIGLHRDSTRFKVEPVETQRRRELFWELFTYDSWQCLTFGRPPSFALPHIDCKMPYMNNISDEHSFHAWKHRFTSECMNLLHDQAFGAKMPTYATVLQLDKKMRTFPVPSVLQVAGFGEGGSDSYPETIMLTLQRHIVLAIREMNLLYLHRSFFARAINDHPKDPLGSPYGTSVIAAYRSAGSLVALMRNLFTQLKEPSERMWFLWTHMFSCSIVLGSIVTRCPSLSLAPSALMQLKTACDLFSKTAPGFRAGKVLEIMLHLQKRAQYSLEEFRQGKDFLLARKHRFLSEADTSTEENDELSMLGGKTRLIAKRESTSPKVMERSPISNNPVVPLPLSPHLHGNVDSSLLEYLASFTQMQQQQIPTSQHQSSPSQTGFSDPERTSSSVPFDISNIQSSPSNFERAIFVKGGEALHQHGQPNAQTQNILYQPYHAQQDVGKNHSCGNINGNDLPQYFSVYDYGTGGMAGGSGGNSYTHTSPLQDMPPGSSRKNAGSPECNLQTTWQDFVTGLTIYQS